MAHLSSGGGDLQRAHGTVQQLGSSGDCGESLVVVGHEVLNNDFLDMLVGLGSPTDNQLLSGSAPQIREWAPQIREWHDTRHRETALSSQ